jgi:hypothetical protein
LLTGPTPKAIHLAKQFVDISMPLRDAFNKVVELIDKIANVDAAHRKGLRERHCAWERLTEQRNAAWMLVAEHSLGKGGLT